MCDVGVGPSGFLLLAGDMGIFLSAAVVMVLFVGAPRRFHGPAIGFLVASRSCLAAPEEKTRRLMMCFGGEYIYVSGGCEWLGGWVGGRGGF